MKTQILDQTQSMGQKKTDKCKWQRIKGEKGVWVEGAAPACDILWWKNSAEIRHLLL
jgi:hypothetical protein